MTNVDPTLKIQFHDEIVSAFQQEDSNLRPTVDIKQCPGKTLHISIAQPNDNVYELQKGADITPANTQFTEVNINPTRDGWFDYVATWEELQSSSNLRQSIIKQCAGAMARRQDAKIIAALNASTNSALTLPTANKLDYAAMTLIHSTFTDNNVPLKDMYAVIGSGGYNDLMSDTKVTSMDFVTKHNAETGMIQFFQGFNFVHMPAAQLPIPTPGKKRHFFYTKDAVTLAVVQDIKTYIEWIPQKLLYMVGADMMTEVKIVQQEGVQFADIDN